MQKYSLSLILLFAYSSLIACSFSRDPFCSALRQFPERNVLMGSLINADSTGGDFLVMEVLRGTETRDTVRIWDGTDFDCNGTWSMAAADIGAIGDTFILMLPIITEMENTWDVMGDYRREGWHSDQVELRVSSGIVYGFLTYLNMPYPDNHLYRAPYEDVQSSVTNFGDCSTLISSVDERQNFDEQIIIRNPVSSQIVLQLPTNLVMERVSLYASSGQCVAHQTAIQTTRFDLNVDHLPAGLYLLVLQSKTGQRITRKIIKQ